MSCNFPNHVLSLQGPQRKLTVKEVVLLALMKLKFGLPTELIADIFLISKELGSQIFNTWIKFIAKQLRPMIYWPKLSHSLRAYPNLRSTIDCSEIFIARPRDLKIQAFNFSWSDYKKYNTFKFLMGIAPNGMISFLSKTWGGRASDQFITRQSGFLDKVEPRDLILADRAFPLHEDLVKKGATLTILPLSTGIVK